MNLATVVLMALAVHFGGAEIDLAREVSLEWFRASLLEEAWELQSRSDGAYTFVAGNSVAGNPNASTVLVERLSAPDRTYSVTHLRSDEIETVSVVALIDLPQGSAVGRAGPPGTPIYVGQDGILAAIERRGAEGTDIGGAVTATEVAGDPGTSDDPATPDGPATSDGPALGRYEITRGRGLITLIDAVSAQVLTMRF